MARKMLPVRETVIFGAYKGQPLHWIVLEESDCARLLLMEHIVCQRAFQDKYRGITWKDCTLRKWLNGRFFRASFTEAERKLLLPSPNEEEGGDRVFLFTKEEIEKYMPNREERRARLMTSPSEGKYLWWWLRTPGTEGYGYKDDRSGDSYYAVSVDDKGLIDIGGGIVSNQLVGVRPAIYLKKS